MSLSRRNRERRTIKNDKPKIVDPPQILERPRICCIDLSDDAIATLRRTGLNLSKGTLGVKVRVPNSVRGHYKELLINCHFPSNLHEYDIIVIDLDQFSIIEYKIEDHTRKIHTGKSATSIISRFPETLFDPRPVASSFLGKALNKIKDRMHLVIAFSSKSYEIEYEPLILDKGEYKGGGSVHHNIYSFWEGIPTREDKYGTEIRIEEIREDLFKLLKKHTLGAHYNQTFHHPTIRKNNQWINSSRYRPLMKNLDGEIISFVEIGERKNFILFPQIKEKGGFLQEFFLEVAPAIYQELFPLSTTFNWKEQETYWLPNHSELLNAKSNVDKEYKQKLEECESRIASNIDAFSFLHEMISETDDKLVKAVIKFLEWLEFEKVIDYDEVKEKSAPFEEDIQVEVLAGLLIIECKGIGGTSKDSQCGQISKVKHRRCRERNKFDVSALYIVNHQRYLPPLKRQNPPFSEHQIQDAINDERGLLTTWQLFNLYFDIENGIISKEEARASFLD